MSDPKVKMEFYPPGHIALNDLTYVVMGAKVDKQWIFVRNKDRETWELPAGHIEKDETADEAARRELYEETGTREAHLEVIHDYLVDIDGDVKYGRLFFARIIERGSIPDSEIAEIRISSKTPGRATYAYAHQRFLEILGNYE